MRLPPSRSLQQLRHHRNQLARKQHRQTLVRDLAIERLESRCLLAVDPSLEIDSNLAAMGFETRELAETRSIQVAVLSKDVAINSSVILPTITTTSFASTGTLPFLTSELKVTFSVPVLNADLASSYQLQRAGFDGILGNVDDQVISVVANAVNNEVALSFVGLFEDTYRLTVFDTITDGGGVRLDGDDNGAAGGAAVRDFVVSPSGTTLFDASFGAGSGKVLTNLGSGNLQLRDMAIQNDGKIVVVGNASDPNADIALVRYHTNGTLDTSFDGDGKATISLSNSYEQATSVFVLNDGKIIVSGSMRAGANDQFFVLRLHSNGSIDSSFDSDGWATTQFGQQSTAEAAVIQNDGKIVVVGWIVTGPGAFDFALARFTSTGPLDTTLDGDGMVVTPIGNMDVPQSVALQADGKIVLAGRTQGNPVSDSFALARYNPDGSLDSSFDGDGKLTTSFGGNGSYARSVAIQADGKIVAAGYTNTFTAGSVVAVARYNVDGSLDNTFDGDGKAAIANGYSNATGEEVVIDSDQKIVVAGGASWDVIPDFGIVRLNVDGSRDTTFDEDGTFVARISPGNDWLETMDVQSDGRILTAVTAQNGTNYEFALARFSNRVGNVNLTTSNGLTFEVDNHVLGVGQLLNGPSNAFDGLNRLKVAGVDYQPVASQLGTMEDIGRTIVTPSITISNLNVRREITVPSGGLYDFARTMEVFSNPTATPITVPVQWIGNLGSDSATTVFATSDGDSIVEPTDSWFGTDDADGSGSPAIIHLLRNNNGIQTTSIQTVGDNIVWSYSVTVPAGQTVRLSHFTALATMRSNAQAAAVALLGDSSSFGGQAGIYLTPGEIGSLLNFRFNQFPTDIALSNQTIDENLPINSTVGLLSTVDNDFGDTHTYSFATGVGDIDNASFSIVGNALKASSVFNFEEKSIYSVRVRTTDAFGSSFEKSFSINIRNVNEAPTSISLTLTNLNLSENTDTTSGISLSLISIADDSLGTNVLSLSGADASFFALNAGNELRLVSNVTLNYEAKFSYVVAVNVDDGTVGTTPDASTTFTLNLIDVNEPPTSATFNPSFPSIREDRSTAAPIYLATVNVMDDALGTESLTLSGVDANVFELVGNELHLKAGVVLDYESKSSYLVSVHVDDMSVGATPDVSVEYTLNILDVDESPPKVVSVTPSINGGALLYGTTQLQVLYSKDVLGAQLGTSFDLRNQGADGILGTADDHISAIAAGYASKQSTLAFSSLVEGTYRLTVTSSILDSEGQFLDGNSDGVGGDNWTRDFVVIRGDAEPVQPLSRATSSSTADNASTMPSTNRRSISDDGRYVVFHSGARNLDRTLLPFSSTGITQAYRRDLLTGELTSFSYTPLIGGPATLYLSPSFSNDGLYAVAQSNNEIRRWDFSNNTSAVASRSSSGLDSNNLSSNASVSSNGRYVAFESLGDNLVPNDLNGRRDIFVKDLATESIVSASSSTGSQNANGDSMLPFIASDGQHVVFVSQASNLVASDTNGFADIFIKNLVSGALTNLSRNVAGQLANGPSSNPSLSSDGNYVVFESTASNLVDDDNNGGSDIFIKNVATGAISRLSLDETGTEGDSDSVMPSLSSDGRFVTFASFASNLISDDTNDTADVFMKDLLTGSVLRVSSDAVWNQGDATSLSSSSVSQNGTSVVFSSSARNLVPLDRNAFSDVFVKNTQTGFLSTATPAFAGTPLRLANAASSNLLSVSGVSTSELRIARTMSTDGRFAAFISSANNLVSGAVPSGINHVYVTDTLTGNLQIVSADSNNVAGNFTSNSPSMSGDGRLVTFSSGATNLIAGDTNLFSDIFVKDLSTGVVARVSVNVNGNQADNASYGSAISANGRYVAFSSLASNLVLGEYVVPNATPREHVYVKDLVTGNVVRASSNQHGTPGSGTSRLASISDDGEFVAFQSTASNLLDPNLDTGTATDVYVKNLRTGEVTHVSVGMSGNPTNGSSQHATISSDGRFVAFRSAATDLVSSDTNGFDDVFLRDLSTGTTTIVSSSRTGSQGNNLSQLPMISGDGRYVAFSSTATTFVSNDTSTTDVFVKDTLTGAIAKIALGAFTGSTSAPSLSLDGRHVSFVSTYSTGFSTTVSPNATNVFRISNPLLASEMGSQVNLVGPTGTAFSIDAHAHGAGQLLQGTNNAFDGLNRLRVGGIDFAPSTAPKSSTEDGGRTLMTPIATMSGLHVWREVTVPSVGSIDFARTIDSFNNPTSTGITSPVRIVGNLGSDSNTTVFATSDGDLIVEETDTWFGTDDANGTGAPAVIHVMHGAFGLRPTNVQVINDNVVWDYSLTVPAHTTLRLGLLTLVGNNRSELIASANALVGTAAGLTAQASIYLASEEIASLVNFRANQTPTALNLSNTSIDENRSIGTSVGTLVTSDSDANDSHVYSLVSGTGSTDNGRFTIENNELKTAAVLDYETQNTFAIRVRATDLFGAFTEQTFAITVNNLNDPPTNLAVVPSISSIAENTPVASAMNLATIAFDDDALGVASLSISGVDASYFDISGNQLRLRAGTILDYETNSSYEVIVNLDDPSVGLSPDKSVAFILTINDVDDTAPTIVSTSLLLSEGVFSTQTTSFEIEFSEAVLGGDVASHFELRGQGPDGILGNSDDSMVTLSASYLLRTSTVSFAPLTEGVYRLSVRDSIADTVGILLDGNNDRQPGGFWVRDFVVVDAFGTGDEDLMPLLDLNGNVLYKSIIPSPRSFLHVNGITYFVGTTEQTGSELWRTDGTIAGTFLVKDIAEGALSSLSGTGTANSLTNVNGTIYFAANEGSGRQLWKTDGTTAGTVRVKNTPVLPSLLTNVNGTLFFRARDDASSYELWKSDGTEDGTVLVKDILATTSPSTHVSNLTNLNGTLLFRANDGVTGEELWKSDGTPDGTVMVKNIRLEIPNNPTLGSTPTSFTVVDGILYFTAIDTFNGRELWRSDGTADGTVLVKNINVNGSSSPTSLVNVAGTLYFSANDGLTGFELWKSDGTAEGTVFVKDISSGLNSSYPRVPTNVNGTLYFAANNGTEGEELWKSDGTADGTILVKDIFPGNTNSTLAFLTNVNGTLFFRAEDGINGFELWQTNGNEAGTTLVRDIDPGSVSSNPSYLANVNGSLYFRASTTTNGSQFWKSDGTSVGTVAFDVKRVSTQNESVDKLIELNGSLYFVANDGTNGSSLWKSNGTIAGTELVKDINPTSIASYIGELLNVSGTLYFLANDGLTGTELWKSDGTSIGTVLVKDISIGNTSSQIQGLTNVDGTLYFTAIDSATNGRELWKSNGTPDGTLMVSDIAPGAISSSPQNLTNVNGTLYFLANDGLTGYELWKSNGTTAETTLVKDIVVGPSSSTVSPLVNVNGMIYFAAVGTVYGSALWKTDGTTAGTTMVKDIQTSFTLSPNSPSWTNVNGTLYFWASEGVNGTELWKSDGTVMGTELVKDIRPGVSSSYAGASLNVNGTLFFVANDGSSGAELWRSDGTNAGTRQVKDIRLGLSSSSVIRLKNVNGYLYFQANDGMRGSELWRSDGTSVGTSFVSDIARASSSLPEDFVVLGNRLYFTAATTSFGRGLYSFDLSLPPDRFDFVTSNGRVLDVDAFGYGTGQLINGPGSAFDGLSRLQVDGNDFLTVGTQATTFDDSEQTLVTPSISMSELDVHREVTVPRTGTHDFARTIDVFTNSTDSDITVQARIVGNLGSDGNTTVFATSDGDLIVEPTDSWFGTDDANGTGTPAMIHLLHGPVGLIPASVAVIGDNVTWTYDLTVAAGETTRLAQFTVLGTTRQDAIDAVRAMMTLTSFNQAAASFLTAAELASLANFQFLPLPSITGIYAASSTWSPLFIDAIDGGGVGSGNGLGYAVTPGMTIPNNAGIDRIILQFSEPVTGVNTANVKLLGVNVADYASLMSISYDATNRRGIIQLSTAIVRDKIRLGIFDAIANAASVPLDGDRNGTPGGTLDLRFNMLVGDANNDGSVNGGDLPHFASAFNTSFGSLVYNARADWNADGSVNGGDLPLFATRFNQSLPVGEPGALNFLLPGSEVNSESESEAEVEWELHAPIVDVFYSELDEEDELLLMSGS